jgi:glycosyltransferase involved in cell wall biosynthesis
MPCSNGCGILASSRTVDMRVLILGDYPTHKYTTELGLSNGSVGRVTSWNENLAESLAALDEVEVHVITRCTAEQTTAVQRGPLTITFLAVPKLVNAVTLFGWTALEAIRTARRSNPDVVHGIGTEHIWPTAALMSRYPTVVTVHGVMNNIVKRVKLPLLSRKRWLRLWFSILERRVLRRAEHLISISPHVEASLGELTNAAIYPVENPISQRFFDVDARPGDSAKILFVGNTGRLKSLLTLLRGFARLRKGWATGNWHIAVVGPTSKEPYHDRVMNYIHQQNLEDRVVFKGFMLPSDLIEEYRTSALLALSSIEETAPMCIAEAMAAGLPVVATNVGGVSHMVADEETGFLSAPSKPAEMAEHLESLMTSPDLRDDMGKRARLVAGERWHPDKIAQQTLAVYRSVLGGYR